MLQPLSDGGIQFFDIVHLDTFAIRRIVISTPGGCGALVYCCIDFTSNRYSFSIRHFECSFGNGNSLGRDVGTDDAIGKVACSGIIIVNLAEKTFVEIVPVFKGKMFR